jgi:hypothetical protein
MVNGFQEKDKGSPNEGKTISGNGNGKDEENSAHDPKGDIPISGLRNGGNRKTPVESKAPEQFCSLENPRNNRGVGHTIPNPSQHGISRYVDVIPILEGEVYHFEEKPEGKRPQHQQEEFPPSVHQKGIALDSVDDAVTDEDICPPCEAVEPGIERVNLPKHHDLGEDQNSQTDSSMKHFSG